MSKKPRSRKLRQTLRFMRRRLIDDQNGATAVEYAMVAGGIAVAIAAAVTSLGSKTLALYTSVAAAFN